MPSRKAPTTRGKASQLPRAAERKTPKPRPSKPTAVPAVRRLTRAIPAVPIITEAQLLRVEPGLHSLAIAAAQGEACDVAGMILPTVFVTAPDAGREGTVELIGVPRGGVWIDAAGGTVTMRAPAAGGHI